MMGDGQVSDRRTVLQAIGAVAGLAATRAVSADRGRLSGASGPLGSVGIDSAAETVPGGNGEWAYVATDTGFVTVDISDPGSPTVEATRTVSEIGGILDLDIEPETDRLTVPGPANGGALDIEHPGDDPETPSATAGFGLYRLSRPSVRGRTEIEDFRDERWTPSNEPASGRCPRAADERLRLSNHLTPRVKAIEKLTKPRFVQLIQSETHKEGLKILI